MADESRRVEFYFSFISLYSYIGIAAWRELVARQRLAVDYKPVDLMAVFAATGGLPVAQRAPARQAYRMVEMQRWRIARGIPLVLRLLAASDDPSLAAEATALTQEAIARQVFGAPFVFWRGEPFWGQDRFEQLEAAMTSGREPIPYGAA